MTTKAASTWEAKATASRPPPIVDSGDAAEFDQTGAGGQVGGGIGGIPAAAHCCQGP